MSEIDSEIADRIIRDRSWNGDLIDCEKLRHLILSELEKKSTVIEEQTEIIDSITGLWQELTQWGANLFAVVRRIELARSWLVRESIVDHPAPYRLRLIASGDAEDIIDSLTRVRDEIAFEHFELKTESLLRLNSGSALCDWDIQEK